MRLANTNLLNRKALLALVAAVALAGCSSAQKDPDMGSTGMESNPDSTDTSGTYAAGERETINSTDRDTDTGSDSMMSTDNDSGMLSQTVFYFDFDQALIKPEAYSALKAHARNITNNPNASVRLEGHADERGTREYNIALGERRGKAVAKFLKVNGVSSSQIEVISFGEEKPLSDGHNESSWGQNRRVELRY
ncbi:MAG: peptidoglycan-associated lipoprotein Pal [Pseudomonadales bacterium]|nr:peptidoglycan-associated lipoprotein Pal [Pseudomonadales bacterium]